MSKVIYVVFGEAGMYSDWRKWPVRAMTTEQAAKDYVLKAQAKDRELEAKYSEDKYEISGMYKDKSDGILVNPYGYGHLPKLFEEAEKNGDVILTTRTEYDKPNSRFNEVECYKIGNKYDTNNENTLTGDSTQYSYMPIVLEE